MFYVTNIEKEYVNAMITLQLEIKTCALADEYVDFECCTGAPNILQKKFK